MNDKIELIKAEAERLIESSISACHHHKSSRVLMLKGLLDFINSLPEEPSLPSDVDEAAEKYAEESCFDDPEFTATKLAFKAGAEWMAGQGISFEDEIGFYYYKGKPSGVSGDDVNFSQEIQALLKSHNIYKNDKVIVQIRRKE